MKTILSGTIAAMALLAVSPAAAQTGGVVTVDLNRIFAESAAGKSGSGQIQTKYQAQAQTQQNTLNAAITAYNTSVEAARKLVKPDGSLPDANRTAVQQAQARVQQADETLNRTQQEANAVGGYVREQILRALAPLSEQVRAEKRASAVLPRSEALAADPAADVTTTLIQRLDAQLKTVSIALPQQQAAAPAAQRPATTPPQGR